MDFFDVIAKRYSYRGKFKPGTVPESDIRQILDAGIRAPSGFNAQTTRFVAVTDETLRQQIAALTPSPATETAPVLLVPVSERVVMPNGMVFEVEDYGACVENILLAITAKGYAAVWMDGRVKADGIAGKIAALLHVPEGFTVRAVIPFGVPEEPGVQKERKPFAQRVSFNRFA